MLASQYFLKCHKMPLSTWHNKHGQNIIFLPKLHSPVVIWHICTNSNLNFCVAKLKLWFFLNYSSYPTVKIDWSLSFLTDTTNSKSTPSLDYDNSLLSFPLFLLSLILPCCSSDTLGMVPVSLPGMLVQVNVCCAPVSISRSSYSNSHVWPLYTKLQSLTSLVLFLFLFSFSMFLSLCNTSTIFNNLSLFFLLFFIFWSVSPTELNTGQDSVLFNDDYWALKTRAGTWGYYLVFVNGINAGIKIP